MVDIRKEKIKAFTEDCRKNHIQSIKNFDKDVLVSFDNGNRYVLGDNDILLLTNIYNYIKKAF